MPARSSPVYRFLSRWFSWWNLHHLSRGPRGGPPCTYVIISCPARPLLSPLGGKIQMFHYYEGWTTSYYFYHRASVTGRRSVQIGWGVPGWAVVGCPPILLLVIMMMENIEEYSKQSNNRVCRLFCQFWSKCSEDVADTVWKSVPKVF